MIFSHFQLISYKIVNVALKTMIAWYIHAEYMHAQNSQTEKSKELCYSWLISISRLLDKMHPKVLMNMNSFPSHQIDIEWINWLELIKSWNVYVCTFSWSHGYTHVASTGQYFVILSFFFLSAVLEWIVVLVWNKMNFNGKICQIKTKHTHRQRERE